MERKYEILKSFYGYDSFRPGQEKIIDMLLKGRDVLGIMPTGAGKSLCNQIPALLMPGLTLVLSPLISLMEDQVKALKSKRIKAAFINSSQPKTVLLKTLENARKGELKILYLSPERLETEAFLSFTKEADISFICIDEAHCVSQWGKEFRPAYRKIGAYADSLAVRPVVGAFTATATAEVKTDIIELLHLRNPFCMATGFDRKNLYYEVRKPKDKWTELLALLKKYRGECGIIYCLTRKTTEAVAKRLVFEGISTVRYHGGLPLEERRASQASWLADENSVMAATNAFGMGIDKPDVRFVIHYNMPGDMESYYQEAGRAGRDGLPADCILLYDYRDIVINRFFINHPSAPESKDAPQPDSIDEPPEIPAGRFPDSAGTYGRKSSSEDPGKKHLTITPVLKYLKKYPGQMHSSEDPERRQLTETPVLKYLKKVPGQMHSAEDPGKKRLKELQRKRLRKMQYYVSGKMCLRAAMLEYFGEHAPHFCGKCSVCLSHDPVPSKKKHIAGEEDPELYRELRALRLRISKEKGLLPYRIFSDQTLHGFASVWPLTLFSMLTVEGSGILNCIKYGADFLIEIRAWNDTH